MSQGSARPWGHQGSVDGDDGAGGPAGNGFLSDDYAAGLASPDPTTANTLVGGYYDFAFTDDGSIAIIQIAPDTGENSPSFPFRIRREINNAFPVRTRYGAFETKYDQFGPSAIAGGGFLDWQIIDSADTAHKYLELSTGIDRQITATGYTPTFVDGQITTFIQWSMLERFNDQFLPWYIDSNGVQQRYGLYPSGYVGRLFANQVNMYGTNTIDALPDNGNRLVYDAIAIGLGSGAGTNVSGRAEFVLDSNTVDSGGYPGHFEWWVHTTPGSPIALGMSLSDVGLIVPGQLAAGASVLSSVQVATLQVTASAELDGELLTKAIAAPSTPAAGFGAVYVDSTSKNLAVKDDAGVIKHAVQTKAAVASNFLTAITDAGVVSAAQPAFSDLTGSIGAAQLSPWTTDTAASNVQNLASSLSMSGDQEYEFRIVIVAPNASVNWRLEPNTLATNQESRMVFTDGTTVGGASFTEIHLADSTATATHWIEGRIMCISGQNRLFLYRGYSIVGGTSFENTVAGVWKVSTAITSLRIHADTATGIQTGSLISVRKV